MSEPRTQNRKMFWRIVRRLLSANPGRLFVVMLALGSGATITAALLNLQVDAKQRLVTEFRVFGPNLIVAPVTAAAGTPAATIPANTLQQFPPQQNGQPVRRSGFLYTIAEVTGFPDSIGAAHSPAKSVVIAGVSLAGENELRKIIPYQAVEEKKPTSAGAQTCEVGVSAAKEFGVHAGSRLEMKEDTERASCVVSEVRSFGGPEDSQIFIEISEAQRLAKLPDQLSLIQASIAGSSRELEDYILRLKQALPTVEVRPVRQFTEAEGKIYNRISGLLSVTVGIVLVLTGLCVLAAMTNVAMERRNDVGLMKAIGGSVRRVVRFFLVEAALLGLIAGLLGAAAGMALSAVLGKAVFGVAAQPRLIVYPVAVGLTVVVAILSSYPLRRLASVRPASVFRGEA